MLEPLRTQATPQMLDPKDWEVLLNDESLGILHADGITLVQDNTHQITDVYFKLLDQTLLEQLLDDIKGQSFVLTIKAIKGFPIRLEAEFADSKSTLQTGEPIWTEVHFKTKGSMPL